MPDKKIDCKKLSATHKLYIEKLIRRHNLLQKKLDAQKPAENEFKKIKDELRSIFAGHPAVELDTMLVTGQYRSTVAHMVKGYKTWFWTAVKKP